MGEMTMKTILLSLLVFVLNGPAFAADFSKPSNRTGKWDLGFLVNQVGSWDVTSRNGSTIDVDSETGWGFLVGYNYNEHFNLAFEYTHNAQDYNTIIYPESGPAENIQHTLDNDAINFNFTYNILAKTFTPYVSGGLGWTELDSNIVSSEINTGCWWDPWWGYICAPYYSTYGDYAFAYSAGAGVRWDVSPQISLKLGIDYKRMKLDGIGDYGAMYVGKFGVVWMN
jgi:opacity protein-like surface antigen